MTKRDLFRIIIKIIGLYFILQIPLNVFNLVGTVLNTKYLNSKVWYDFVEILFILFTSVVVAGMFIFFIFKSDKLIDALKLDKNFDSDKIIAFDNISAREVLKVGIILVAGASFVNDIGPAINSCFYIVSEDTTAPHHVGYSLNNFNYLIFTKNIVCVIISLILIFNSSQLAEYLLPDKKDSGIYHSS